ncbi:MAG: DNA repair protein RecO [Bacteroidales bacterium]|nr:DNA repair protein RecO [Bacteroidales bacterium]
MLSKTRGIILHHVKYGESGIIVHIYTEHYGRQSCIVNISKSRRSSVKQSSLLPLSLVDLEIYFKEGKEIHRIKEISNYLPLISIHQEIIKSTIAIFIAELLCKTLHEAESNPQMFEFLFHAIQYLDAESDGVGNFHVMFLVQYSKFLGIFPKFDLNSLFNKEFSERSFSYINDFEFFLNLPKDTLNSLEEFSYKSFQDIGEIKINYETRMLLLEKLLDFYKLHFENIGQIKSLQVMKEVFH